MRKIMLVCGSVLAALLVLAGASELYLRWSSPYWTIDDTLQFENAIFSRHIISPEQQTVKRFSNPDQTLEINRHGYRGDDFPRKKADTETRVIIYGGSQVFDHTGKPPGWPDRTENYLARRGYDNVEIINAGVPGHASFDSFGKLFSNDHYLNPDYVILDNAWNDFKYFHYEDPPIRETPTYRTEDNIRRYYQNGVDRFLGETSQLYTFLRLYLLEYFLDPGRTTENVEPRDQPTEAAIRQYRLTVDSFVQFSTRIGATPVLMTQPRLITETISQRNNRKIAYHYLKLNKTGLLKAYRTSDRIMRSVASSSPAILFDASQVMTGNVDYFVDHVHFTDDGSQVMVKKFGQKMIDLLQSDTHQNQNSR